MTTGHEQRRDARQPPGDELTGRPTSALCRRDLEALRAEGAICELTSRPMIRSAIADP
jgi:hypothetical protein